MTENQTVTLPLHQRLQLIKMSKRLKTNSQALRVLKSERLVGAKWKAIEDERSSKDVSSASTNSSP